MTAKICSFMFWEYVSSSNIKLEKPKTKRNTTKQTKQKEQGMHAWNWPLYKWEPSALTLGWKVISSEKMRLKSVSTFWHQNSFYLLFGDNKKHLPKDLLQSRLNNIYTLMALITTYVSKQVAKEAWIYNYIDGIITNQACIQFMV